MNNIALSSSVSSLLLIEKQMGVVSNNISNANTAGYTEETEQVGELVTGGIGSGVQDLGTTSNVDQFLLESVNKANSTASQATSYNSYYQNLQQIMGQITGSATGGNDISSQLATLQTSLSQLATTPQNTSLGDQVVSNLDDFTANMRSLSQQIQTLRSNADQQISNTVADANTQLNAINTLNTQIETAQATNQPTASLSDLRNQALQSLTADIGVGYYTAGNGALQIYTTSGQPLLAGNVVSELSHTAESISGKMSYPSGGIGGIMVGTTDITGTIASGTLASLIQQRDTELPSAQNSLNYLAQTLSTSLNAVSNQGSASPPPSQLIGSVAATTDPVTPSSSLSTPPGQDLTVRIALVDSTGQVQAYQDIDLAGLTSVGQIVSQINTAFGTTVASVNGAGQLQMNAPASGAIVNSGSSGSQQSVTLSAPTGLAISTLQGTLGGANQVGTDFSSFFHLNDVITGGASAATISVNPAMLANATLLPVGTLNNTQPAPTLPFSGVGAGDGSTAAAMSSALLANQTFTGGTATGTVTFGSASSVANVSGTFVINGGSKLVQVQVSAGETLSDIAAAINAAAVTAGAQTVTTNPDGSQTIAGVQAQLVGYGAYQLQITSGGNSLNFTKSYGNALSGLGITGSPTGYLGNSTTTFGGFASNLISDVASRATSAQNEQTSTSTTLSALQTSLSNQSGVNIDQQTAQLSTLQNLYAASARVITTVNAMFSSLITAMNS